MRKEIKNMKKKNYVSRIAEKEREYYRMLAIVSKIKTAPDWQERLIWIGSSECYTPDKESLDVIYKFFKEEKLDKLYKELQQIKKEYLEQVTKED